MPNREGLVVHRMGQQGLRVEGIHQIDAFVIGGAVEIIGASAQHDERARQAANRPWPGYRQGGAGPFADGTQPPTQSWRVIWVRDGMAFSVASVKVMGVGNQTVDPQCPIGVPVSMWR